MSNVTYRYITRENFDKLGEAANPHELYYVKEADGSLSHYKGQSPVVPAPNEAGRSWGDLKKVAFTEKYEDLQGVPKSLPPDGEAGGDLKGNFPNPTLDEDKLKSKTVAFEEATLRDNIASGETLSRLFGKIKRWLSSLAKVAFSGSYKDLADTPALPTAEEVKTLLASRATPPIAAQPTQLLLRTRRTERGVTCVEAKVCIAEEEVKDFLSKKPYLALLRKKLRRVPSRGRKPRRVERKYTLTTGSNRPTTRYVNVPVTESHLNRWGGTGYTVERLANLFLFGRNAQGDMVELHSGIAAARLQVVVVSGSRYPHRLPPVADSNRHLCWEGGLLLCYADSTAKSGFEGVVRVDERRYTVGYAVAGGRLHEKFMLQ